MAITAKERIRALKDILGQPKEDEWYYVWVRPRHLRDIYSAREMVEWCQENRTVFWEYKWVDDKVYKEWAYPQALATLYPNRELCFRFSKPEDAALFKLTWS